MKLSITRSIMLSALAVALSLGASKASAETAKFDLPVEAHWGAAVLSPGSYKLSLPISPSGVHIFYLDGDAGIQMAVPSIVNIKESSGPSRLTLVNVDGTYYVRDYTSEARGTTMRFSVPKTDHRQLNLQTRVIQLSGF